MQSTCKSGSSHCKSTTKKRIQNGGGGIGDFFLFSPDEKKKKKRVGRQKICYLFGLKRNWLPPWWRADGPLRFLFNSFQFLRLYFFGFSFWNFAGVFICVTGHQVKEVVRLDSRRCRKKAVHPSSVRSGHAILLLLVNCYSSSSSLVPSYVCCFTSRVPTIPEM